MRLSDRPGYARLGDLAFVLLGPVPASSPVRLPDIGTLRLDPAAVLALGPLRIPAPAGVVTSNLPGPPNPWLAGREVLLQGVVLDTVCR